MQSWMVPLKVLITVYSVSISLTNGWNTNGDWSYKDPDNWKDKYPTCDAKNLYQSPILLNPKDSDKIEFEISHYNDPFMRRVALVSNGYFVQMEIDKSVSSSNIKPPTFVGIGDDVYYISRLEFHWPPEHKIIENDASVDHVLEVQFHYKSEEDEMVILSFMHQECDDITYSGLEEITRVLKENDGRLTDVNMVLGSITMSIPSACPGFKYMGSLTSPPCTTNVTWIVFSDPELPVCVTSDQMEVFRSLKDKDGKKLPPNNRPLFSREGRDVSYFECP